MDPQAESSSAATNTNNSSAAGSDAGTLDDAGANEAKELELRELWLPIANVARIMKQALPANAKISKEAKECVQACVSEFVSFITSEASDKCIYEKRKTVNGEDILFAMASLGMDQYSSVLQIYLAKYRESQMAKLDKEGKSSRRRSGKNDEGEEVEGIMNTTGASGPASVTSTNSQENENEEPSTSRQNEETEPYAYEGNYPDDDGQDDQAVYEDYTGHYTNVDMQY